MTGYRVPGAPAGSTSLSPQQQKQFSSWWLDQQYGGDLNNVPGLTRNENGYWQGDPGRKYDINPETGQRGTFQFLSGSGAPGWLDVTPVKYGYAENLVDSDGNPVTTKVKMVRNRHGIYNPESAYGKEGNWDRQYQFTENPNTGEKGKWIFLGQMGWVNIEGDPQPEPADGTLTFGAGGQIVGEYNSERDNPNGDAYATSDGDSDPTSTTETTEDVTGDTPAPTTSSGMMGGGNLGGSYSGGVTALAPLNVTPPPMINSGGRVDFVRALNSSLATNVMRGMMTGARR